PQNPFREMRGPAGAKRAAGMYHSAFSDGRIEIDDQIADGDLVVTRWTGKGTQDGELMGMPPTGKWVEVSGITIDRIAGEQIAATAPPCLTRGANDETWPRSSQRTRGQSTGGGDSPGDRRRASASPPHQLIATYLVSRYSAIPSKPPSRPKPECLTPPNGAAG